MSRISSQGSRLYVQSGPLAIGPTISAVSKAKPAVVTITGTSLQFAKGSIATISGTGWRSLDGKSFQISDITGSNLTLFDSDTTKETTDIAIDGTINPVDMIEFCVANFSLTMPAGETLDTTTICDDDRSIEGGMPGIATWTARGFWDSVDISQDIIRALYRSREFVTFVVVFKDKSGLIFNSNVNSLDITAGINQAVAISTGGSINGTVNVLAGAEAGVDVPVIGSTLYLAPYLGYMNVFIKGRTRPLSFSQQGDFKLAYWVTPTKIGVIGPDPEFPEGFLIMRTVPGITNTLWVWVSNGQSNGAGGGGSFTPANNPPPLTLTVDAPLPSNCYVWNAGMAPTQDGVGATGVTTIIDPACFDHLVPMKENINDATRIPGKEVIDRELWMTAFGETVMNQLDPSNKGLFITVNHGSTDFPDDMQKAAVYTGFNWASGVGTYQFTFDTNVRQGDSFVGTQSSVGGLNGSFIAAAGTTGFDVKVAMAVDPGAWTPPVPPATNNGFLLVWSAPCVNAKKMLIRARDVIGPALGMQVRFGGLIYQGNEASSDLVTVANYTQGQFPVMRKWADEMDALCSNEQKSVIIIPGVNYPRDSWKELDGSVWGCASNVTLGQLEVTRDPLNKAITFAQYPAKAGGEGDVTPKGAIHFSPFGHSDHGVDAGNFWIDDKLGLDTTPLQIIKGSLTRLVSSPIVVGTFNRAARIEEGMKISNPANGKRGYQAFSGVMTTGGGRGKEVAISKIEINGTSFKATLGSVPPQTWGNRMGYAYMTSLQKRTPASVKIIDATYAGGVASYIGDDVHGLGPGDPIVIARMVPSGFDVDPIEDAVCLAGTAGITVNVAKAVDPGVVNVTGFSWVGAVGTYTIGINATFTKDNKVKLAGNTPAGLNGTFVIKGQPVAGGNQFTVDMAVNPGAFVSGGTVVGGGNIAINGLYCVGRNEGNRGQVCAVNILHYNQRTGAPRPDWQAQQSELIGVETTSNSIMAMLIELGLDTEFDGVFDFGATACYPGTGTLLTNQRAIANTNFTLGDAGARVPIWTGVANNFSRTSIITAQAALGSEINSTSGVSNTLLANAHHAGEGHTIIAGGFLPAAALTRNNYVFATAQCEGGGNAQGIGLRIASNRNVTSLIRTSTGASAFATSFGSGALNANEHYLVGVGIKDGDNTTWQYNGRTNLFTPVSCTFVSPTAGAAQSAPTMMVNGTTGNIYMEPGCGLNFLLVASKKIDMDIAESLMRSLRRRQILNQNPPTP